MVVHWFDTNFFYHSRPLIWYRLILSVIRHKICSPFTLLPFLLLSIINFYFLTRYQQLSAIESVFSLRTLFCMSQSRFSLILSSSTILSYNLIFVIRIVWLYQFSPLFIIIIIIIILNNALYFYSCFMLLIYKFFLINKYFKSSKYFLFFSSYLLISNIDIYVYIKNECWH